MCFIQYIDFLRYFNMSYVHFQLYMLLRGRDIIKDIKTIKMLRTHVGVKKKKTFDNYISII